MRKKNILFLGFGDLATRVCQRLPGWSVVAAARSDKPRADEVEYWQMSVTDERLQDRLASEFFDAVVITLTSASADDAGYRTGYCEPLRQLCRVWQQCPPGRIFFVSSTSVYGQQAGEWVDEGSATEPDGFAGRRMLEAENLLRDAGLPHCTLRFAGIYGPGRDYVVRQVRAGWGGDDSCTNRIHAEDGAAAIAHLVDRHVRALPMEPLYLVCDSEPASAREVRAWIAAQLGLDPQSLQTSSGGRGGNKRCSNARLLASGFELQYPGYREGYRNLLVGSDG